MTDRPPYPGTPRWVKVFGIAVVCLMALAAILLHFRGGLRHKAGPAGSRHTQMNGGH